MNTNPKKSKHWMIENKKRRAVDQLPQDDDKEYYKLLALGKKVKEKMEEQHVRK